MDHEQPHRESEARPSTGHGATSRAITERMKRSAQIRLLAIATYVLPDIEEGSVRFTIKHAHAVVRQVMGWSVQQQHVRSALTAKTLLAFFGIRWVTQDGPATQHQEVQWIWDPNHEILQLLLDDDDEKP